MSEKQKMYKLSFVNDGKPFELGKWTVKKHSEVLRETTKYEKEIKDTSEEERNNKYQTLLILKGLQEIDEKVTEEHINDMHPMDRNEIFSAIFNSGREGIIVDAENFQKKKK
jgi:hypothetical protein